MLIRGDHCTTLNMLKTTELSMIESCYMNYIKKEKERNMHKTLAHRQLFLKGIRVSEVQSHGSSSGLRLGLRSNAWS